MIIQNLFPTGVGSFQYDKELSKKQRDFVIKQEKRPNQGNTTSANRKVLDEPLFKDLKKFVDAAVEEYFQATTAPFFDVKLRVTQSWLNYSEPGQFHHKHAHPNSFISGCFYVNADPTVDKIYFYRDGYERIKIHSENYNPYNSESWWLPVATNQLILFPSYLTHMVETVQAKETRISLAFNTFPVGYVGNDDSLTGLRV